MSDRVGFARVAVFAAVAAVAAGCGGVPDGSRAAVEGTVTVNGKPVDYGSITFVPKAEGAIKTGGEITNGAFNVPAKFGPAPGKYAVEIRWQKPTGKKYKAENGQELDERAEGLPAKFHEKTELTADIAAGPNKLAFDLKADALPPPKAPAAAGPEVATP